MTSVALFELVLALLGAALILSLLAGRLHLPPAVALVLGGMVLALLPRIPAFEIDPDLIMVLFLPPLLMSSAFFTVWRDFVAELKPILFLSVGAVIFTTAFVGVVAHLVMPSLPWAACFTLGAIVSPPDAVAAKAVLERLKLPRRMMTVLEGESLVNDASGLVLYKFAVAAALTGSFSLTRAGASFVWLATGGIAIGIACGWIFMQLAKRLRDAHLLIVASFLASYTSYILAEKAEVSSVLSVVAAGLTVGMRQHEIFTAQTRTQANAVWRLVGFVLEALVFVLIGLALRGVLHRQGGDLSVIWAALPIALWVTMAVVVSRLLWVVPGVYLQRIVWRRFKGHFPTPPVAASMIVGWSGMRGVVTLAAALALPTEFPGRDVILFASFVVILFTVLVQGTTLGPLIKALRLGATPAKPDPMMDVIATRLAVNEAALVVLEAIRHDGATDPAHPKLIEEYRRRVRAMTRARDEGELIFKERDDHFAAALGAVVSSRGELIRLHRERKIHDSVLRTIEAELDLEELRLKRLSGALAE